MSRLRTAFPLFVPVGPAIRWRLVEAMGGQIGVDSTLGVGSTFWFVVRASAAGRPGPAPTPPPPEPLSPSAAAELARRADGPPRRLLYIEDYTASRGLLQQLVAHRGGFDLASAATVADGLRMARRCDPETILIDLHLPDGSGEDVVHALRADPLTAGIPVVVLTADATPTRRERAPRDGCRGLPHQARRRRRPVRRARHGQARS